MNMAKEVNSLIAMLLLLALSSSSINAFSVDPKVPAHGIRISSPMHMSQHNEEDRCLVSKRREFLTRAFGVITLSTALTANVDKASAMNSASSIYMADAIKTMDMGLPSYGAISDAKASIETVEGLAEDYTVPESKPERKKREPKTKADGEGGNFMGNVLPSMNKGGASKPKSKPVAPKPKKKEKEAKAPEVETVDMSLPSYGDSTAAKEKSVFGV